MSYLSDVSCPLFSPFLVGTEYAGRLNALYAPIVGLSPAGINTILFFVVLHIHFFSLLSSFLSWERNEAKKPPRGAPQGELPLRANPPRTPPSAAHTKIQAAAASLRALVCVVGAV